MGVMFMDILCWMVVVGMEGMVVQVMMVMFLEDFIGKVLD